MAAVVVSFIGGLRFRWIGPQQPTALAVVCPHGQVQSGAPRPLVSVIDHPASLVAAATPRQGGNALARIAIVYYSSTGHNHALALAVAAGAEAEGAETRVRRVRELAPDAAIDSRPGWREHLEATRDIPEAELADLEWADGFVFGTPTRFGLPAAQMKQFLDQTGGLWSQGKLQDKPVSVFGGAGNPHGGQESTLLALNNVFYHWGSIIVPTGYTDAAFRAAGGNPYGISFTASKDGPSVEAIEGARVLGRRIARFAAVLSEGRARLSAKKD
jgi:NAD(P)H dehydrogenase (quinone)